MKQSILKLCNRRMLTVALLGFSSGLPLTLLITPLQAWFKISGADIIIIGYLSMLTQPFSYKFFWAPLIDKFDMPFLGRRRGWIFTCQALIMCLAMIMGCFEPEHAAFIIFTIAAVMAFTSATQDIAIDAYRTDILTAEERGLGVAVAVESYRIAMIIGGAVALLIADSIGFQKTYFIMAGLMGIGMIGTLIGPPLLSQNSTIEGIKTSSLMDNIIASLRDLLNRPKIGAIILIILTFKLCEVFVHALSTPFLIELNFSLSEIAYIHKMLGVIASIIGIFAGGLILSRINLAYALLIFAIIQAVTNLLYIILTITGKHYSIAYATVFLDFMSGGMGTAALVALIMSLCNPNYSATQYALFSSLAAMGRLISGYSGHVVNDYGWQTFFISSGILALPSILLIIYYFPVLFALGLEKSKKSPSHHQPHQQPLQAPAVLKET